MVFPHRECGCAAVDPALIANRLTLNESLGPALPFRYAVGTFLKSLKPNNMERR
jgi:hypothetical protein